MYITCGMFPLHRESQTIEGQMTNVWLLRVSLKHSLDFDVVHLATWPGCRGCSADAWCVSDTWEGPSVQSLPLSCEDNPAKLLILIVGNCDDPSTCKGLALQGIDTSVRKTCFWCELRNKSCLHNLGAWHAREKYRGRAEMENNRVPQCSFLRKKWRHTDFWALVSWEMPCLLLLLNLPFTPASWLNRLLPLLGCNSAICPSCRDDPGITAARLCS